MTRISPIRRKAVWTPTHVIYEGTIMPLTNYTALTGISAKMLDQRLHVFGWSEGDALFKPCNKGGRRHKGDKILGEQDAR